MFDDVMSIRYLRALIDVVEHQGLSRSGFIAAAHLDQDQLVAVEGRVQSSEFARVCELALDATRDPALGLHVLEAVQRDSVELVCALVGYAATARTALEGLIRAHELLGDASRYELNERDREVTLRYVCQQGGPLRVRRFLAELHIVGSLRLLRHFARHAKVRRVCFEHAATSYRDEYVRIFAGAECFDQPFTGIVFDRELLDVKRKYHDEEFHRALCDLAENRVLRIARSSSCADRVRALLAGHSALGKATMEEAAHALDMSPRTLRRRLAAEGTCYNSIAIESLATKARYLLLTEQRTIEETAYAMGYSNPTAFHRAFKRWTGTTPRSWRSVTGAGRG